jgi:hypothetical protein
MVLEPSLLPTDVRDRSYNQGKLRCMMYSHVTQLRGSKQNHFPIDSAICEEQGSNGSNPGENQRKL